MIDEQTDKPRSSFWRELPILLGVAILVAVLVRAFVLQTFFIPSPSMEHTLKIDDRVLVNKLVYDFRVAAPRRGHRLQGARPTGSGDPDGEDFIKRVIGVGGDHVVCCDAQDRLIDQRQVARRAVHLLRRRRRRRTRPADQEFDITVPAGRLWVMGDHRSASGDSLEHWQQSRQNIDRGHHPGGRGGRAGRSRSSGRSTGPPG